MIRAVFQSHPRSASLVCFCVEFLLISGAVLLAAALWLRAHGLAVQQTVFYLPRAAVMALVCQLSMYYAELYDFRLSRHQGQVCLKLLLAFSGAMVALTVIFYLVPSLFLGRGIFVLSCALAFSALVAWRLTYYRVRSSAQMRTRVLIVGTGAEARRLASELLAHRPGGYEVRGFLGETAEVGRTIL